jgi:hypothetical protein
MRSWKVGERRRFGPDALTYSPSNSRIIAS